MAQNSEKKICVISMARNDEFFIAKWIDYYGAQLGLQNLYLVLDGLYQPLPEKHESINVIQKAHQALSRAKGDRYRARLVSDIAKDLFNKYDIVIAHDIDEFLVVDPGCNQTLAKYLQKETKSSTLSALGLDVGQHIEKESTIDPDRPFLQQRRYAHVSSRYTKAIVAKKPIIWGSGYHRVKGKNFKIDPNLFLFHFGMVDYEQCKRKIKNEELNKNGWTAHFDRRFKLFSMILKQEPIDGDSFFPKARRRQNLFRPVYALNKPGMLREKPIIRIPERFKNIV